MNEIINALSLACARHEFYGSHLQYLTIAGTKTISLWKLWERSG